MAVKVATFGATATPIVHIKKIALAAHHVHFRPISLLIGPYMKLENPITRRTAALVMLMLDEVVFRSSAISDTTEKSDVEENVAARAVNERQKMMRDLCQSGREKYGEGMVDVRVRLILSPVA